MDDHETRYCQGYHNEKKNTERIPPRDEQNSGNEEDDVRQQHEKTVHAPRSFFTDWPHSISPFFELLSI